MKKLIVLFLMAMSFSLIYAYHFIYDGIYYKVLDTNPVGAIDYDVVICSEYENTADEFPTDTYVGDIIISVTPYFIFPNLDPYYIDVLGIGENAFRNCKITSCVITWDCFYMNIYSKAFADCTELRDVTICTEDHYITSIDATAFDGCTSLTSLKINSKKPPKVYNSFEENLVKQCILYVPLGYKVLYEKTPDWQVFRYIEEYDFSELEKINSSNQNVSQSK